MGGVCEVCGNHYDQMMTITVGDQSGSFDCFECAVHALAPKCQHCGVRILGHGLQEEEQFFCCASCARMSGQAHFVDRVSEIKL